MQQSRAISAIQAERYNIGAQRNFAFSDFTALKNQVSDLNELNFQPVENLGCSENFSERNFALAEFGALNFQGTSYMDSQGKEKPEYIMTKDGFVFQAMGFTGKPANV